MVSNGRTKDFVYSEYGRALVELFCWTLGFWLWPLAKPIEALLIDRCLRQHERYGRDPYDKEKWVMTAFGGILIIVALIAPDSFNVRISILALYSAGLIVQIYLFLYVGAGGWLEFMPYFSWPFIAVLMIVGDRLSEGPPPVSLQKQDCGIALACGVLSVLIIRYYGWQDAWDMTWPLIASVALYFYAMFLTVLVWEEHRLLNRD